MVAPLGISFFTFQALSYLFDVYRGKYPAERNLANYALYVAFFPSVIAGPINRYDALKPQFLHLARPDYQAMAKGLKMILWGMFLKTVIADRLLLYVNPVLDNYQQHSGSELLTASVLYSIQLLHRLCRLLTPSHRFGSHARHPIATKLLQSLLCHLHHRLLASLAHQPVAVVARLHLHSPGRQSVQQGAHLSQHSDYLPGERHLAWSNWTFLVWGALHGAFQAAEKALGIARRQAHHKYDGSEEASD